MTARVMRVGTRSRAALPWLALGAGLVLATEPVWGLYLLGFNPTLDDLLRLGCFTAPPETARTP